MAATRVKEERHPLDRFGRLLPVWAEQISARIKTDLAGCPLVAFDEVESTSDVAKALADRGAPDGTTVIARSQSAGRGRRGRTWESPPGKALYLSMVLRPRLAASDASWLGILGGLAAASACERLGVPRLSIKWPNDVLAEGRKICGVLTEPRVAEDKVDFAVLGFGVNVAQADEDWPDDLRSAATSCRMQGVQASCEDAACALLEAVDAMYGLLRGKRTDSMLDEWIRWSGTSRLPVLD
jgi:BirA family transcriptional regulator, biotin operon repressor / biotin---[acetyl-CoA-carboxylase] ligase